MEDNGSVHENDKRKKGLIEEKLTQNEGIILEMNIHKRKDLIPISQRRKKKTKKKKINEECQKSTKEKKITKEIILPIT